MAWALLFLAVLLTLAALVWVSRLFIAAVRSSTPRPAERPIARTAQFVGAAAEYALVLTFIAILVIVALKFLQPTISNTLNLTACCSL